MKVLDYNALGIYKKGIIKNCINYFYLILTYPLYLICTLLKSFNNKKDFKYTISLCLIFKDESNFLREWIEYHKLIGVDHFYLYNNDSKDNYKEVLKTYIEQDIVTLIDFPGNYRQLEAYNHCYENFKDKSQWLAFIDADEFINIKNYNNIQDLLLKFKADPTLYLQWRMFGTSGHMKENSSKLVIESYTQCWNCLCTTGKCFINNRFKKFNIGIHRHFIKFMGIRMPGRSINRSLTYNNTILYKNNIDKEGYLNHYWSKSLEFYKYKDFLKGDVASEKNIKIKAMENRFKNHELNNKVKDFSIQRWIIFLKENLLS